MEDLRLLATEHDFVVLEGANGEKYRLAIDEPLKHALRTDKGPKLEASSVSPREIQELVRAGNSIAEIVARTGASTTYVEKFASPVLDELQHIINSALSDSLRLLGDRYGETNHVEFGVLIREKLDKLAAFDAIWTARRIDTGGWQVTCRFTADGLPTEAKWSFDLKRLSLSPDNEVALNLAANSDSDSLLPKPKAGFGQSQAPKNGFTNFSTAVNDKKVEPHSAQLASEGSETPLVNKNLTSSLGETQEFAEIIPFGRGRNTTAQVPVIAAGTSAEVDVDGDATIDDDEDLMTGFRRLRDAREAGDGFKPILSVVGEQSDGISNDDDFDETTVWIEQDEILIEDDVETFVASDSQEVDVERAPVTATKKGRATMPSWDEIVFGTRPDAKDD